MKSFLCLERDLNVGKDIPIMKTKLGTRGTSGIISILLIFFLISVFIAGAPPGAFAQDTNDERKIVSAISIRGEGSDTQIGTSFGVRLSGEQNIWGFASGLFSDDYDTGELQFGKFFVSNEDFNIGILASPLSADWLKDPATNDITTYVTGFGGVVGNYWFTHDISLYGVMQWKFDYDAESQLWTKEGWMWQVGVAFNGPTFGLHL